MSAGLGIKVERPRIAPPLPSTRGPAPDGAAWAKAHPNMTAAIGTGDTERVVLALAGWPAPMQRDLDRLEAALAAVPFHEREQIEPVKRAVRTEVLSWGSKGGTSSGLTAAIAAAEAVVTRIECERADRTAREQRRAAARARLTPELGPDVAALARGFGAMLPPDSRADAWRAVLVAPEVVEQIGALDAELRAAGNVIPSGDFAFVGWDLRSSDPAVVLLALHRLAGKAAELVALQRAALAVDKIRQRFENEAQRAIESEAGVLRGEIEAAVRTASDEADRRAEELRERLADIRAATEELAALDREEAAPRATAAEEGRTRASGGFVRVRP